MTGSDHAAPTSAPFHLLIQENISLLQQGIDLIGSLPDGVYAKNDGEYFQSGVGRHFRHVLDFYGQFLSGDDGWINYDSRERELRVETDPGYAADHAGATIMALEALNPGGVSTVQVRVDTGTADEQGVITRSTLERELAHLASHTIHHYAIIRLLLSTLGVAVDEAFGIAPSTLRYRKQLGGN